MSDVDLKTSEGKVHQIRKGSSQAIQAFVEENNGIYSQKVIDIVSDLARQGATRGTGLGLSIVKGFVEAQSGIVSVANNKKGGAVFTIKIPTK